MTVQWIKTKSQKPAPIGVVEIIPKRGAASFRLITTVKPAVSVPVAELPFVIRNLNVDWKIGSNSNPPLPSVAEEKLPTRGSVNWAGPKSQKPAPIGVVEIIPKRGAASFRLITTVKPAVSVPVAELPFVIRNLNVDWKIGSNSNPPLPSVAEEKLPTRGSVNWAGPKSQKPAPIGVVEIIPKRGAASFRLITTVKPAVSVPVAELPFVIRNLNVDWKIGSNSNPPLPSVAEEKLPTRGSVNWAGPKSQKPTPAEPTTETITQRGAADWKIGSTGPTIETPVVKNLVHEHVKQNVTKLLRKFMSR